MIGVATNKLRAKAANTTNRKTSAFNRGRHRVVGNNKSGAINVFKREQHRFNACISLYKFNPLFISLCVLGLH